MKPTYFPLSLRVLHWLMAVLVLAMLLIGLGMVASVSPRHAALVAIHKPLAPRCWYWCCCVFWCA